MPRKSKPDICPPKAFTDKLIRLEKETGLDQSEIIRALVMAGNPQLVRVCAGEIGLIVPVEKPELIVAGPVEHSYDAHQLTEAA